MSKFFRVIIPTYNNAQTIKRALRSVCEQSFQDFHLIVVDDCSEDDTLGVISRSDYVSRIDLKLTLKEKKWNGGTRNIAKSFYGEDKYTLFLDGDDDFANPGVFAAIHKTIIDNKYPDMVRLPYYRHNPDGEVIDQTARLINEKNIAGVAKNCRVACWTKCVKSEKLQPFPENTLMEDVCQHLLQCDVTDSVVWMNEPIVNWRIRKDSTSNSYSPKWKSSAYRFVADLMDIKLNKPYCIERKEEKLKEALKNLSEGKYEQ